MSKKTDDEEQQGGFGFILVFTIAAAVLVGLYAFSRTLTPTIQEAPELPLASIMIEVNELDGATRANIVALEEELRKTGVFHAPFGPADMKVLVPAAKPGEVPVAKEFAKLTDDEWKKAWTYVAMTEYLVPRMYRNDGTACVIRLDPKGLREFAPDAGAKLLKACEGFRDKFKTFRVYSRALGIGTAADRDALNASFGVQLCWIALSFPDIQGVQGATPWQTASGMNKLAQARPVLSSNKHFRRISSDANWVSYYWSVKLQTEKEAPLPTRDEDVAEAFAFAKANALILLHTANGKFSLVDTSTDVEGQENVRLIYDMAANLQTELKVDATHPYQPPINTPFKGDGK